MKPGIKTTEFWVSLAGLVGGLGSLFGLLPQESLNGLTGAAAQVAGGLIADPVPGLPRGAGRRPGNSGSMPAAPRALRLWRHAFLSALGYAVSRGKAKGS